MASQIPIHVISRENNTVHHTTVSSISDLPELRAGRVRARTFVIALTANNLTYCKLGSLMHWWGAFLLPTDLPEPYNDSSMYGIVPTWGYGEVLESKVDGIVPGTLIWGYWPPNSLPIDLQLVPGEPNGHWTDLTEHRQDMMSYYHRYQVSEPQLPIANLGPEDIETMAWETVYKAVWACGFMINRYNFGSPPIHPLGTAGGEWTNEDADISSAVVINLSASGKTARAFTDAVFHSRSPGTEPLGFMAITSKPESRLLPASSTAVPAKTVSYADATSEDTLAWIASKQPTKLIIVDFGGRANSLASLTSALRSQLPSSKLVIIGVGGEAKAMESTDELAAFAKSREIPDRVQMNTSTVREAAIERDGAEAVFGELEEGWRAFVKRGNLDGLKLELGRGVEGEDGFEGGWRKLCEGKAADVDGLAYRFDQ